METGPFKQRVKKLTCKDLTIQHVLSLPVLETVEANVIFTPMGDYCSLRVDALTFSTQILLWLIAGLSKGVVWFRHDIADHITNKVIQSMIHQRYDTPLLALRGNSLEIRCTGWWWIQQCPNMTSFEIQLNQCWRLQHNPSTYDHTVHALWHAYMKDVNSFH